MKVMNPRLVRIAKKLDVAWNLLARIAPQKHSLFGGPVKSILIVDLHLLGDIVMLVPLFQALRKRYPAAKICLMSGPWAAQLLAADVIIDEIVPYVAPWVKPKGAFSAIFEYCQIAYAMRARNWDVGIDVRGDIRQILLLYLAGCKERIGFDFTGGGALLTKIVPDDGKIRHILHHHEQIAATLDAWNEIPFVPALSLTSDEKQSAELIAPYIGFHLGASLPLRQLPSKEVISLLCAKEFKEERIVLFSTPDMEGYIAEIFSKLPQAVVHRIEVWQGGLRDFLVQVSRAKKMFTMDSGPAHISAALGRETIVFFGPNLSQNTGPRGKNVRFVEDALVLCRPCDQHHCTNPSYQACMLQLVNDWRHHPTMTTKSAAD